MAVYEGSEKYIFISYAHKNTQAVMKVVDELMNRGYRVWFDAGIAPGSEWPENIAQHLDRSAAVIAFVTSDSMASDNCRREIHFALSRKKPFLSVFLEKTELPLGMELQLAAQQNVLRYNYRTEQEFVEKICNCEFLQPCRSSAMSSAVTMEAPQAELIPSQAASVRSGKKWGMYAGAGLLAVAALAAGLTLKKSGTETVKAADEIPSSTAAVQTAEPAEQAKSMKLNDMRPAEAGWELQNAGYSYDEKDKAPFWGQTEYRRNQVKTVQFHSTLTGTPDSAWDISANGDGSVLAWMDGSALHAAADGKIALLDGRYLFYGFSNLKSIEWTDCIDTSKVTGMMSMFEGCSSLESVDVANFDTSNVTNMGHMFQECFKLENLDVSGFDTAKVTDANYMFFSCSSLESLDVTGFDTSNMVDMSSMFRNCGYLKSLDVSGFDTSNAENMACMFERCSSLERIDVGGFDTSQATNVGGMFGSCSSLRELDVTGFDTSKATDVVRMFAGCSSLELLDVSGFKTSEVTDMMEMFNGCEGLTELDVSGFDTSKVTRMRWMFRGCSSLENLDVSGFDTSKVTDMSRMFFDCSELTSLDVSHFNTSNVTDMEGMFYHCSGLSELDVSGFDTSNATDMSMMFADCSGLRSLNVNGFVQNGTTAKLEMFRGCSLLPESSIPKWYSGNR